jgi:hypothetical protein
MYWSHKFNRPTFSSFFVNYLVCEFPIGAGCGGFVFWFLFLLWVVFFDCLVVVVVVDRYFSLLFVVIRICLSINLGRKTLQIAGIPQRAPKKGKGETGERFDLVGGFWRCCGHLSVVDPIE